MPITMTEGLAVFEGICAVEEAEPLLEWLQKTATPQIDLSRCEHVHTSILQTLLAVRPAVVAASPDALLVRLLGSASGALDEEFERSD